jgi:hypothetical protein
VLCAGVQGPTGDPFANDLTAMALKRLQARAAIRVPDLDGAVVGRRRQLGRVVRAGHRINTTTMALERLQARAAAGVLDYDSVVVVRRRQSGRVV